VPRNQLEIVIHGSSARTTSKFSLLPTTHGFIFIPSLTAVLVVAGAALSGPPNTRRRGRAEEGIRRYGQPSRTRKGGR